MVAGQKKTEHRASLVGQAEKLGQDIYHARASSALIPLPDHTNRVGVWKRTEGGWVTAAVYFGFCFGVENHFMWQVQEICRSSVFKSNLTCSRCFINWVFGAFVFRGNTDVCTRTGPRLRLFNWTDAFNPSCTIRSTPVISLRCRQTQLRDPWRKNRVR